MAWLRQQPGVGSVFTVGFCFGGSRSWGQSAAGHDLAGCIGFYGQPAAVADLVPLMRSPLLLMAAGEDHTPVEAVEAFAAEVRGEGVECDRGGVPGRAAQLLRPEFRRTPRSVRAGLASHA